MSCCGKLPKAKWGETKQVVFWGRPGSLYGLATKSFYGKVKPGDTLLVYEADIEADRARNFKRIDGCDESKEVSNGNHIQA